MILLALLSAHIGFGALALAMDRHHRQVFGRGPGTPLRITLRIVGASALAASFAACVAGSGWSIGAVEWFGVLSAAPLTLVLLLAYRPRSASPC
jgi:hypothetical protein